jgi:hypothetical protein
MRQVAVPDQYSTNPPMREPGRGEFLQANAAASAVLAALMLYALVFVASSLDVMDRLWEVRAWFASPSELGALLYFEGVRTAITLGGLAVAGLAVGGARRQPAAWWLAFAAGFATIAYTKALAFPGYPGYRTQAVMDAARQSAAPDWLLAVLLAHPEWAAWLALGGALLFAASFPHTLTAAELGHRAPAGRAGTLRSVAVAGADVGETARRAAAAMTRNGWLRPARVWPAATLVAAAHTAAAVSGIAPPPVLTAAALLLAAAACALGITLFRAGAARARGQALRTMRWLRRGALAALALFGASAIAGVALPGSAVSVGLLSLAPAALVAGGLLALLAAPAARTLAPDPAGA